MIRPRQRGARYGISSGYWTVTFFLKIWMNTFQSVARMLSMRHAPPSSSRQHPGAREQEIREGEREHDLPAEGHELVVARARQRGAQQDEEADEQHRLDHEPGDGREEGRSEPATHEE